MTHDDQIACDFLQDQGWQVEAIPWGRDVRQILSDKLDLLVVRSPWDYMDSGENCSSFFHWLRELKVCGVPIANAFELLEWNLDKHYLQDFAKLAIPTVPTVFLEATDSLDKLFEAQKEWLQIVVKPCISAAAKDTFLIRNSQDLEDLCLGRGEYLQPFATLRKDRAFMLQPFLQDIASVGEWSLIFLDELYSHAVLKLPKKGAWLVQDELGGSVQCLEPSPKLRDFAEESFETLKPFLRQRFPDPYLLYARLDFMPGNLLGELELVEPELFFLDRRTSQANLKALEKFHRGVLKVIVH